MGRTTHLIVRRDGVLCTICYCLEPVHPGDGTSMDTFLMGLEGTARRHPPEEHGNPFRVAKLPEKGLQNAIKLLRREATR